MAARQNYGRAPTGILVSSLQDLPQAFTNLIQLPVFQQNVGHLPYTWAGIGQSGQE